MKAQVSVEGMLSMSIVLAIFALVIFSTLSARETAGNLEDFLKKREECIRVSEDLYSAFVLGDGTTVFTKINRIVDIVNDTIYVRSTLGDQAVICDSRAPVVTSSLTKGYARIENLNGVLVIANV